MMAAIRTRLRVAVVAWLLAQAATLAAFVPRDCCEGHAHARAEAQVPPGTTCHRQVTPVVECPMPGPDGTPCPMHRGHANTPSSKECRMTGSCPGPSAALLAVLSNHGVLADIATATPDAGAGQAVAPIAERVTPFFTPPDSPPPRR